MPYEYKIEKKYEMPIFTGLILKTKNQKPKTKNQKPKTKNQKPKTQKKENIKNDF